MNSAAVPNFRLTGNVAVDGAILKLIALMVGGLVTWASTKLNLNDPEFINYLTTALMGVFIGVATFAYGWVLSKVNQAKAVQAGINLTASGNALTVHGDPVPMAAPSTVPVLPVTAQSASQIIKNYSPPN